MGLPFRIRQQTNCRFLQIAPKAAVSGVNASCLYVFRLIRRFDRQEQLARWYTSGDIAFAGNANRGTTGTLAILTGRHAAHCDRDVLRNSAEVQTYFFPHFFMTRSEIVNSWIEESRKHPPKEPGGAGALRIVEHKGKYYFVDERCRQLRNVEDFMDQIKFKTSGELLSFKVNECQQVT